MRKRILSKKIAATFLVAAMMAVPVLSGATAFAADEGTANEGAEDVDHQVTVNASSESQTIEVGNVTSNANGICVTGADNKNTATVIAGDIQANRTGVDISNITNDSAAIVKTGDINTSSDGAIINNVTNGSAVNVETDNITTGGPGIVINGIRGNSAVEVNAETVSTIDYGICIENIHGSSVEVDVNEYKSDHGIIINGINDEEGVESTIKVNTGAIDAIFPIRSVSNTSGSVNIEVNGSVTGEPYYCIYLEQANKGTTNVTVKGDVISSNSIMNHTVGARLEPKEKGKTNLVIDGDIITDEVGIYFLPDNENATADVLVGGTINTQYYPVLVSGSDDYFANCLSLTAWRIIPNVKGEVAYFRKNNTAVNKEEFDKKIMYIIKVEQPTEGGKISLTDKNGNALATSHDYEVANEGDIVKINPEKGYKLTAVYNGVDGNKLDVIPDSDGNYYVQVPKGGGVYLTATLEKEKYDISFYDEEGNLIQTNNVEYGGTITIPNAPTKDGYEFLYWEGSKYYPGDQYTVTGPHTFKAIWKKVEEKPADNKDEDASADKKDENTVADSDSKTTDNTSDKAIDSSDSKTNEAASSAETATNISKPVASASPSTADNTNLLMVFIVMMLSASCAALAGDLKYKLNK